MLETKINSEFVKEWEWYEQLREAKALPSFGSLSLHQNSGSTIYNQKLKTNQAVEFCLSLATAFLIVVGSAFGLSLVEKKVMPIVSEFFKSKPAEAASNKQPTANSQQLTVNNKQQTANKKQLTGNRRQLIVKRQPTRDYPVRRTPLNPLYKRGIPTPLQGRGVVNTEKQNNKTIPTFKAQKMIQSERVITATPNQEVFFDVGFKNTGKTAWQSEGKNAVTILTKDKVNQFQHPSWSKGQVAALNESRVKPGEIGYFHLKLLAPQKEGGYRETFVLKVDEAKVASGEIEVVMKVIAGDDDDEKKIIATKSPGSPRASSGTNNQLSMVSNSSPFISEPKIRVGLYHTFAPIEVVASGDYEIRDDGDQLLMTISAGLKSILSFGFVTKNYFLTTPGPTLENNNSFKFVPKTKETIFEILNYENRPQWNKNLNDNKFRGSLEVRFAPFTNRLWLINELPLEEYLKGLAETSNNSPLEFQKALVIAARTYALYHYLNPLKHQLENYTIDDDFDQVYRGYHSELRLPQVVMAQEATYGQVITYNGEVVVTPYFSRSDGRTRAWQEVWAGGPKLYLESKPVPQDLGQSLWGHGVGMSARAAILMAEEGKGYEEILKYFYSDVEIAKVY